MTNKIVHFGIVFCCSLLCACQIGYRQTSPDVVYSTDSAVAANLQVPPDLNNVSDGEQFVLPGTAGGPVTRNTLLPAFKSVEFVRRGEQSWLEIANSPEDVWPRLLAFAKKERFKIEQTQPVAGVIVTQWRPLSASETGSLLKNLIGDKDAQTRMAFRLERAGNGTRLFTRVQVAAAEEAATAAEWPEASYYPENTNELLSRLLVYLGVDEQRVNGILSDAQAANVLDDAVLQTTGSGKLLLVHQGYESSYQAIETALTDLNYRVVGSNSSVGQIQIEDAAATQLLVTVMPVHVSAVRVSLKGADGVALPASKEESVLASLRDALA